MTSHIVIRESGYVPGIFPVIREHATLQHHPPHPLVWRIPAVRLPHSSGSEQLSGGLCRARYDYIIVEDIGIEPQAHGECETLLVG